MTPFSKAEMNDSSIEAGSTADDKLPLVVFPRSCTSDRDGMSAALRSCAERYLSRLGCILFRGFAVHDELQLREFARAADSPLRAGPVYSPWARDAHTYLPSQRGCASCVADVLHSECLPYAPRNLWLHCAQSDPAVSHSHIADNRSVYRLVKAAIRAALSDRGLLYVRNFDAPDGSDWASAFGTSDRGELSAYCQRHDLQLEWKSDGGLRVQQRGMAVARHPRTRELLWLNQLHLLHTPLATALPAAPERDRLPNNVYYGDGAAIEASLVDEVRAAYDAARSVVRWEPGDVLLLDNLVTAHSLVPGTQARVRIAVSEG